MTELRPIARAMRSLVTIFMIANYPLSMELVVVVLKGLSWLWWNRWVA